MSELFGPTYAAAYDSLYEEKDYEAECDLVERLLRAHGDARATRDVLDLGCGTGGHSLVLARRGHRVVGVDRSEAMLAHAREKAAALAPGAHVSFRQGDVGGLSLDERFDAALMMFAVLGYQIENDDVLSALKSARRHLRAGGLLIFDVWHGPAVLSRRPSGRVKVTPTESGEILRAASGELDTAQSVCAVRYNVWLLEGGRVAGRAEEVHRMRYFFPAEMELFLSLAGFALLKLGALPDYERQPDETTWNAVYTARAA